MAESVPVINVYPIGSIGEQSEWEIRENETARAYDGVRPCPHAINFRTEPAYTPRPNLVPPMTTRWEVPRTIVVYTQGHNDYTSVCADCVLEALRP